MSDEEFIITTADMLEIVAGGGNGVELVNINALLEQAAKELREKDEEIAEWEEAHKGRCKDWLYWKDQDARLREENARLRDLLSEGDAVLSWVLLEGMDEAIPTTCPVEYERVVDAAKAIADAVREGGKDDAP